MKEKKWRVELTEHQLRLIANCVEDCHRFIGGQMELSNSTACLKHGRHLGEELSTLQAFVTPLLERGASYGWNGGSCPDKNLSDGKRYFDNEPSEYDIKGKWEEEK